MEMEPLVSKPKWLWIYVCIYISMSNQFKKLFFCKFKKALKKIKSSLGSLNQTRTSKHNILKSVSRRQIGFKMK